MFFLAINMGCYEGWKLTEYESTKEVLEAIQSGETYTYPFKIFKEIKIEIKEK